MAFLINLPNITAETWLNSEPLTEKDLKNKIVLVDFFTYSCVNCIRTLKHLKQLHKKYTDLGLLIIGIHTPEFDFEKSVSNVATALKDLKIKWPVALDNDLNLWHLFANKFWPSKYLANKDQKIIYSHFGEGHYLETENEIRQLLGLEPLSEKEFKLEDPLKTNFCLKPTPETYLGYHRGKPANQEELVYDIPYNFVKLEDLPEDRFSLNGQFILKPEFVETINYNSIINLHFSATEINLVTIPVGEQCTAEIRLNGEKLPDSLSGKDVINGTVKIDKHRMYELVKADMGISGILTIQPFEGNFRAFAFTFSGCN